MIVGVVASQPVDIPRKGTKPTSKEGLSPAGHQLIDHAIVVCCGVFDVARDPSNEVQEKMYVRRCHYKT